MLPELLWGNAAPPSEPVCGERGGPSHRHAARPAVGGTPPSHPQTLVPASCTWRASQTPFLGTQELREGGCLRGGAQRALQRGPSAGRGTGSLLCPCRLGRVHQGAVDPWQGGPWLRVSAKQPRPAPASPRPVSARLCPTAPASLPRSHLV